MVVRVQRVTLFVYILYLYTYKESEKYTPNVMIYIM